MTTKGYFLYVKERFYPKVVIGYFIKQYDDNYRKKDTCWEKTTTGVYYFEFTTAKERTDFLENVMGIRWEMIEY